MNRRKQGLAALGSLLLSCAIALALVLPRDAGRRGRTEPRADVGKISIDPEWARQLAERPRDPTGLTDSGVRSQVHGGDPNSTGQGGNNSSRLFRTGHPGLEPTLGVTGNGWIFYIAINTTDASGYPGYGSVVIRSKDGGTSWETVTAPRGTEDPYLWVDPTTDRIFAVDWLWAAGLMSYSDDFGETWTNVPPVGTGHNTDHQTIYAGPPVTSKTSGYPNIVYYCSIGGGVAASASTEIACSKSLDGGHTFLPTPTPPFPPIPTSTVGIAVNTVPGYCPGGSGHVFVGVDGTVYVPRGVCGQPWLAISRDEGTTWTRVQVADNGMGRDAFGGWDHEGAVRADGNGNVFYSWVARDRIPYLAVSRDRGLNWGAPVRIAPPDVKEANLPNMDMDEDGRLAFVYMGSTDSPGAPFPNDGNCTLEHQILHPDTAEADCVEGANAYSNVAWNGYITMTNNPLEARPAFETAPINAPDNPLIRGECGPFRCQAEYDFLDVEFGPTGEIFASLIDACEPGRACTDIGEAILGVLVEGGSGASPANTEVEPEGRGLVLGAFSPAALLIFAGLLVGRRRRLMGSTRARSRGALIIAFAASSSLAGCGSGVPAEPAQDGTKQKPVAVEWKANRLAIDVPVQVITIGLPESTVLELRALLQPQLVDYLALDSRQPLHPDPDDPDDDLKDPQASGEIFPNPVLPTAHYEVHQASDALEQAFGARLKQARLENADAIFLDELYHANVMEDWLVQHLPRDGLRLDPNAPSVVLVHLEAFGIGKHAWKLFGDQGYIAPIRVFSERYPLLILDPSAEPDVSWAGSGGYLSPVPPGETGLIADFVDAAVEYRLLQGSILPTAPGACHAVTFVLGVRAASVSELSDLQTRYLERFDPLQIKSAFDRLTNANVFFDWKVLSLPVDDPALDTLARGAFPTAELQREWLTLNFDNYHVDHPGCEEYLVVGFFGDVVAGYNANLGQGLYDDNPGKRIALAWISDLNHAEFDPSGPVCAARSNYNCRTREYHDWMWVLTHETGHLFGLPHPFQHFYDAFTPPAENFAFTSIWSVMSDQHRDRAITFSAVDRTNWLRNRAGWALLAASQAGREGTPQWNRAMQAARRLDWQGVWAELQD